MVFAQVPDVKHQFEWSINLGVNQNRFETVAGMEAPFANTLNFNNFLEAAHVFKIKDGFFALYGIRFGFNYYRTKATFEPFSVSNTYLPYFRNRPTVNPIMNFKIGVKKTANNPNLVHGFGTFLRFAAVPNSLYCQIGFGASDIDGNYSFVNLSFEKAKHTIEPVFYYSFEYQPSTKLDNRLLIKASLEYSIFPSHYGTFNTSYYTHTGYFRNSPFSILFGLGYILHKK